jgi:hypothetical protein
VLPDARSVLVERVGNKDVSLVMRSSLVRLLGVAPSQISSPMAFSAKLVEHACQTTWNETLSFGCGKQRSADQGPRVACR